MSPGESIESIEGTDESKSLSRPDFMPGGGEMGGLLRQAPLGIYVVDADFRILQVNPIALPVFGNISDLIGRDFDEVIHILWSKEYADEVVRLFRHTLKTGEPYVAPEHIGQRVDRDATEYYEWRIDRIPLPDSRFGVVCYFRDISLQVDAREKIVRSEERYRRLVEQVSDGIFVTDSEGRYIDVNNAAAALLGYTRDELLTLRIPDVLEPGELVRLPEQLERLHKGETVQDDWHFQRKDRSTFVGELVACRLAEGGFQGLVRDVTERRRADDALHESEERLRLATEHAEIGFWDVDPISDVLVWPPRVKAMFGISPDMPVSMTDFYKGLHPEDRGKTREAYAAAADPVLRAVYDVEYRTIGKEDGLLRWVAAKGRGVFDTSGSCIRVIGTAIDITKRKATEAALVESEARFRQLADNISQFAWMTDEKGCIFWYNQRWYDYTGTTLEEMQGWGWQKVHHPEYVQRVTDLFKSHIEKGVEWEDIFPLRSKSGEYRWFLSRAYPLRDDKGDVVRWCGTNTDITEQRGVEAELRRANADLEQFAYSASHDLQEPLRSVSIYSELLHQRYSDRLDGQALEFLTFLREGAGRMELLIRDLLAYTQVSKVELLDEETDAGEALHVSLANLSEAIASTNAKVTSAALPSLRVHRTHIHQLFQNLIGNALKYRSPDKTPEVHVAAERQSSQWLFSVTDNGIGVDPEFKTRIFGLFKRLHTADKYSGTGIGLAICQRIVERYHGRIWVESGREQGSVFYFTLPTS